MSEFLSGPQIVDEIRDSIANAARVDLAIAYWGEGAIPRLGLDGAAIPVRVLCDLSSLGCNPWEIDRLLQKRNVQIKSKDLFHAKVCITPTKVIVGSANASARGLGDPDDMGDLRLEAAVLCSDKPTVSKSSEWFENHWHDAMVVDKPMLEAIKRLWKMKPPGIRLLTVLAALPAFFASNPVKISVFEDSDQDDYDNVWEKVKSKYTPADIEKYTGRHLPIYIDRDNWNVKKGDYVISYWTGPKRQLSPKTFFEGGVWRIRDEIKITLSDRSTVRVILADAINNAYGLRVSNADYRKLGKCIMPFLQKKISGSHTKQRILMDVELSELKERQFSSILSCLHVHAPRRRLTVGVPRLS